MENENKSKQFRKFRSFEDGTVIILCEKTTTTEIGYTRRRFHEDRIAVTREEIAKLARDYPVSGRGSDSPAKG